MPNLVEKDQNTIYLRQSNALTTAAYTLSRNEKRLVYLSLEKIFNGSVVEERGRFDVVIQHSEYASVFDESAKNISRDISKASAALNKREIVFYIPDEDGDDGEKALDGLSWTTKRSVRPKRGTTVLSFNAELVDLLRADARYTGFFLHVVAKLNNQYAMRLYESIRSWVTLMRKNPTSGERSVTFGVDWLIHRYELPASYQRMSDFRRRFLIPAVAEIHAKSDITLTYKENSAKGGRRNSIVSITFTWTEKEEVKGNVDLSFEDYVDLTKPPLRKDHDDDVMVELGLVYLDKFNDESERPCFSWVMDFIVTYQKVRGEAPTDKLKNSLLSLVSH
ncbi:RepB family plasmid replication initiator protein [Vibrio pomeroyi]|uniref:RepB family plasmid replication initiator protein n=1 Tax=Vibrio pomeroyi TaxID=198832 RepID=A0ABV4MRI6_9VIBR|nr:RepB family plasmid replication initiator protein [Vibrio atlanticus]MCZ4310198.1 RepB family plasmid replication initiator protein [Vibrio atlanticus]